MNHPFTPAEFAALAAAYFNWAEPHSLDQAYEASRYYQAPGKPSDAYFMVKTALTVVGVQIA